MNSSAFGLIATASGSTDRSNPLSLVVQAGARTAGAGDLGPAATRVEHDALGAVEVPAEAWWGAQTERSRRNFAISNERMPHELIMAIVLIKREAATLNASLGRLDPGVAAAIVLAADEVLAGALGDPFPLSVWQTGSGTQSHMNVNEVLARRATQLLQAGGLPRTVHPNDHVNAGQSSNDTVPSAIHIAAVRLFHGRLMPALAALIDALDVHARGFADLVKIGRTHLQDAVPMTLGQEFSGYVAQLRIVERALRQAIVPLLSLAQGGTAVGTGINTHPDFARGIAARLAAATGCPFVPSENFFAALAGHEPVVGLHGALRQLAVALNKIANDIRWLASGPRAGLGELTLPANEPGSSIMPGKVNPTQCEAVTMVCARVFGNDTTVGFAASAGVFELNVYQPVIADALLQSLRLLGDAMHGFSVHAIQGLEARTDRLQALVDQSLMLATALAPHIGYDRAAAVAKLAHAQNLNVAEAALQMGVASAEQLAQWLDPQRMLKPEG